MQSQLEIIYRSVLDLTPNPKNPRKASDWNMRKLMRSIERIGIMHPIILDPSLMIISGHKRVEAAKNLGMETVPSIMVPLTGTDAELAMIELNQSTGEWDMDLLAALVEKYSPSERISTGFDEAQIAKMLGEEVKKQEEMMANQTEITTCPTCGQKVKGQ